MWKLLRQTIRSKWNSPRQQPTKPISKPIPNSEQLQLKTTPVLYNVFLRDASVVKFPKNAFDDNADEKQKQKGKSKYSNEDWFFTPHPSIIETVGWLATSFALALNLKFQFCPARYICKDHENYNRKCMHNGLCATFTNLWSHVAFSMPKGSVKKSILPDQSKCEIPVSAKPDEKENTTQETSQSLYKKAYSELRDASIQYIGQIENMTALQLLSKDPAHAFHHFEMAGNLGCDKANFNLGVCYEIGKGTEKNLEKAVHHYRLAASNGHGLAMYNLGIYYLEGLGGLRKDEDTGLRLISKAAKQGIAEAQVCMGIHYLDCQNWNKAFICFQNAAKQENEDGKYHLGLCYENGWGVPIDYTQAAKLFCSAASNGHLDAMFSSATYYEKGLGDLDDIHLAISLYETAAESGHEEAKCRLEELRSNQFEESTIQGAYYNALKIGRGRPKISSIHVSSSSPELSQIGSPTETHPLVNVDFSNYLNITVRDIWEKIQEKRSNFWIGADVTPEFDKRETIPHWTSTPALLTAR